MIRKQFDITEAQDATLAERAQALGIPEAEVVRRALDAFLGESSDGGAQRRSALDRLLKHTRELANGHRLPSDYEFDRDALYANRPSRNAPR